ncbi:3-oxoacyl-ACP synthase, partial [Streptomyces sp. SID4944]|nr:3-oxoacyl-ACP synthase [Streptomyces sp. SID4944]
MSQSADQGTGAGSGTAVAVTGVGLVTPAGADEHSFWEGLCAGHSTARRRPELAGLPVDFACAADDIDLDAAVGGRSVWRMARFVKLAVVAARQAVADAGLDPAVWDGGRVGVVLGVGVGGVSVLVDNAARLAASGPDAVSPLLVPMMIPNAAAGEVAIALKAGGPSLAPATACASGATAVAVARDLLLGGSCDVVVAGGSESVLTP